MSNGSGPEASSVDPDSTSHAAATGATRGHGAEFSQSEQDMSQPQDESSHNDCVSDSGNADASIRTDIPLTNPSKNCSDKGITSDTPTTSYQEGSMKNQPLEGKNDTSDDPRTRKILQLLSHRRLLLERLHRCRKATETRLNLYIDEPPNLYHRETTVKENEPSKKDEEGSTSASPSAALSQLPLDQQIKSYQDLCQYAMTYTNKKPVIEKPTAPPRGSISLRRNPSVGKKMQAAVATLTSNVGWVSDSSSSNANKSLQKQQGITSPTVPQVKMENNGEPGIALDGNSSTTSLSSSHKPLHHPDTQNASHIDKITSHKQAVAPEVKNKKASKKANALVDSQQVKKTGNKAAEPEKPSTSISNSIPSGKQIKASKSNQQETKKKRGGNKRAGSRESSSTAVVPDQSSSSDLPTTSATMPLHHKLNGGHEDEHWESSQPNIEISMDTSSNAMHSKPLCPESEKLRMRKREIEFKLEHIFRAKYAAQLEGGSDDILQNHASELVSQHNDGLSYGNSRSLGKKAAMHLNHRPLTWRSTMGMKFNSTMLPGRKKTQWDHVLEEMRWLATDFMEERKWKQSISGAISCTISSEYSEHQARLSPVKSLAKKAADSCVDKEGSMSTTVSDNVDDTAIDYMDTNDDMNSCHDISDEAIITKCLEDSTYPKPSENDITCIQSQAKGLSSMIDNYWDLVRGNRSASLVVNTITHALEHHKTYRESKMYKEMSYNEISESLEGIGKYCSELRSSVASYTDTVDIEDSSTNLRLHNCQSKLLHFIESLWACDRGASGTIVSGSFGCGKTIATASILWRRRFKGAQLLLCPSSSVVRWAHELNRFSGLNIHTLTPVNSMNEDPDLGERSWKECDVIVCQLSSAHVMYNKGIMATVVVDSRCACLQTYASFDGFKDKTKSSKEKKALRKLEDTKKGTPGITNLSAELNSSKWWNDISAKVLHFETKCIVVECKPLMSDHGLSILEGNVPVEVIAAKTAFLHHTLFHSLYTGYGKRAFSWAKKRYSIVKGASAEGKSNGSIANGPRCVKDVLLGHMRTVKYHQERHHEQPSPRKTSEANSAYLKNFPGWSIRLCNMSPHQRKAYERLCLHTRGSLSTNSSEFEHLKVSIEQQVTLDVDGVKCTDNDTAAAKDLIRLRRACFHSDLPDCITDERLGDNLVFDRWQLGSFMKGSDPTVRKNHMNNASQPNLESAMMFASKSSKLRELLRLLYYDCGYDVQHSVDSLGLPNIREKSKQSRKKKVLILATLPEVLVLTSNFLNSLGIQNQVIVPHATGKGGLSSSESPAYAYLTRCQQAISHFESRNAGDSSQPCWNSNILLTNCAYVGSTSFGLSASSAETIISMDEDWSGREALHMHSFFMKTICTRISVQASEETTFIKLVASETCEETFLTEKDGEQNLSALSPLPSGIMQDYLLTDTDGNIVVAATHEMKAGCLQYLHSGSTLNKNVLRQSNLPLSEVFHVKESIPLSFLSGSELVFLPGREKSLHADGFNHSLSFGKALTQAEFIASSFASLQKHNADSKLLQDADQSTLCPREIERNQSAFGYMERYNTFSIFAEKTPSRYSPPKTLPSEKLGSQKKKKKEHSENQDNGIEISNDGGVKFDKWTTPFLLYECNDGNGFEVDSSNDTNKSKRKRKSNEANGEMNKRSKARNVSSSFRSIQMQDGRQGSESLVYHPPMLLSQLGETDPLQSDSDTENNKRKASTDAVNQSSKKARESKSEIDTLPSQLPLGILSPSELLMPAISTSIADKDLSELNLISSNDPDLLESTASFFDSEFMSELDADPTDDIDKEIAKGTFDVPDPVPVTKDLSVLDADPPLSEQVVDVKQTEFVLTNPYSFWIDPFEPTTTALVDNEEAAELLYKQKAFSLGTILLYVKRRHTNMYDNASLSFSGGPQSLMMSDSKGAIANHSATKDDLHNQTGNQTVLQKKKRKGGDKRQSSVPVPQINFNFSTMNELGGHYMANTTLYGNRSPGLSRSPTAQGQRNEGVILDARALVSFRHKLLNSIILSSSEYSGKRDEVSSKPANRFESKLNTSLSSSFSMNDGDCKDSSLLSTLAPCNVDYGPFSIGFISEMREKKSIRSSRISDGIKLPMGVKVPRGKENQTHTMKMGVNKMVQWSKEDDDRLQGYVKTVGYNWQLISYSFAATAASSNKQAPSSRQCKERWELVANEKVDSAKSETVTSHRNDETSHPLSQIGGLLLPALPRNESSNVALLENEASLQYRKNERKHMKQSVHKVQKIPLPIPAYNNQGVDRSHTEPMKVMWPLQFLEYDKHQKKNTTSSFRQQSKGVSSSQQKASSQTAAPHHTPSYPNHTTQRMHGSRQSTTSIQSNKGKSQKQYIGQQPVTLTTQMNSQSPTRSNTPKNNKHMGPTTPSHSTPYTTIPQNNPSAMIHSASRSTQQIPAPVPYTMQQSGAKNNTSPHPK